MILSINLHSNFSEFQVVQPAGAIVSENILIMTSNHVLSSKKSRMSEVGVDEVKQLLSRLMQKQDIDWHGENTVNQPLWKVVLPQPTKQINRRSWEGGTSYL